MGWMVGVNVIVGATKVAGVLVTLSLAANAFSFSRFRRKYLRPFPSPLFDHLETPHTLAAFCSQSHQGKEEEIEDGDERGGKGKGFFFGLATAPAHVEDRLDDAWLHFAEELPGDHQSHPQQQQQCQQCGHPPSAHTTLESKGKRPVKIAMEAMIRGFQNYIVMDTPDKTSLSQCRHPNPNVAAWHNVPHPEERLRFWSDPDTELKLAKQTGISVFRMGIDWARIMPKEPHNGLQNSVNFAALERYKWIINRVRSYGMKVMLTLFHHSLPPWAGEYGGWKSEKTVDYFLDFTRNISSNSVVGVAHHVSFMRPYGLFDVAAVTLANSLTLFPYVDSISEKLDFIGMNYYGQEVVSGSGLKLVDNDEYSESGRGVYPDGLYRMLLEFHERYKHLNVPFIITENGVSDETDLIRQPYIIEHLLAVYAAMVKGVPVIGYLFWTISDNWEWADGYGPKFGLVAVDRANDLARMPRPSYQLFSKVATSGKITSVDRAHAWDELQRAAKEKIRRPFFRAVNKHGLMYAGGLDVPILRPLSDRDWRFGHYEMEGPQDLLSRFLRSFISPFSRKNKIRPQTDELVLQPLRS